MITTRMNIKIESAYIDAPTMCGPDKVPVFYFNEDEKRSAMEAIFEYFVQFNHLPQIGLTLTLKGFTFKIAGMNYNAGENVVIAFISKSLDYSITS